MLMSAHAREHTNGGVHASTHGMMNAQLGVRMTADAIDQDHSS